ncbi:hypothetical protein V5735_12900 (plasmid) [Haladaptatus sp. SPP-AMP-3]|uniref:DUF7504 family protein n=1 Tax=Haladaptatus sp. SPP-AMP-3 TaxID=3121295 RepID=UPI003C2D832C
MDGRETDEVVATEFARTLQQLKQQGCNLLLVGSVPDDVLSAASRKLFGDPDERRFRVAVLSGTPRTTVYERLPKATLDETATVIAHDTDAMPPHVRSPVVRVDSGIRELTCSISEAITSFDVPGGFRPGELRFGLDSLASMLTRYDPTLVRQFLGIVGGQVRGANGMGHYVLPRPYDHELVGTLAPLFDGIVEYRVDAGREERWHFPDRDLRSPWLPL